MIVNTVIEKINHVRLPPVLTKDTTKELEESFQKWMDLPVQVHVFDFSVVLKLHNSVYGPLMKFKKDVEKTKKAKIISINFRPEVFQKLQNDGMELAIGYIKNLNNLDPNRKKDQAPDIKVWMMKYLIDSAREAMSTMFKVNVTASEGAATPPAGVAPETCYRVAAVNAEGQSFKARLRLYFERACIEGLARVVAEESSPDDALVNSTASEVLNLIYGSAKSKLNDDRGYKLNPAIPQVIPFDQTVSERSATPLDTKWVSFATPLGSYYLEVGFSA